MRSWGLVLFVFPAIRLTEAAAQESGDEGLRQLLCEQCPYDAPIEIPSRDAITPEMKSLGIVTIRDLIEQLPSDVAGKKAPGDNAESKPDSDQPFALGGSIRELRRMQASRRLISEAPAAEPNSGVTRDKSNDSGPDPEHKESEEGATEDEVGR